MNALEFIAQRAREVELSKTAARSGVYLLILNGSVVYIGSSNDVDLRIFQHECGAIDSYSFDREPKVFDRALHIELHPDVMESYEGALIRAFRPEYNRRAPAHRGNDCRLLADLGLPGPNDEDAADRTWRAIVRDKSPPHGNTGKKRPKYSRPPAILPRPVVAAHDLRSRPVDRLDNTSAPGADRSCQNREPRAELSVATLPDDACERVEDSRAGSDEEQEFHGASDNYQIPHAQSEHSNSVLVGGHSRESGVARC